MNLPISQEQFPKLKQLKLGAVTAGLKTKIRIDSNTTLKGLNQIITNFPDLTESFPFNKEKERFKIGNDENDADREVYFDITGFMQLEYVWGPRVEFDYNPQMIKLFDCIQDGFLIQPNNTQMIDVKMYFISKWSGNHYKVIWDAFLGNSVVNELFYPQKILQDDLFLRSILDEKRVCIVSVESNVGDNEVWTDKFKNDRLTAGVGIAQTRNIPSGARLSDIFNEHAQIAFKFIQEKFIPNVVVPLDKTLQNAINNLSLD